MGLIPRGTGRYLMAQLAGIWLWFTFYFIWLLVTSVFVAGWVVSTGRVLLTMLVVVNLCGILLLRKVAHAGVAKHTAEERRKAVALGETEGFVKTIFDADTGELLGAHMIGAEVSELIQGFVLAMGLETTEAELMHAVFPHPSLSEAMLESVLRIISIIAKEC